ncbi:MAG TPA: TonB-dependent receptor, partial [Bacteroidales bacterium]|nr:TonB-dependent receptor [Bacteroidales bacterium]
ETRSNLKYKIQHGSFNTTGMSLSGTSAKNKTYIWGNLSHLGSDGFRENNDYSRNSGISTIRWEHPAWSLNSTLMLTDVRAGIPSSIGKTQLETAPRTAASNWLAVKGYKKYTKAIGALSFKHNTSDIISGEAVVFGKWNNDYERRPFNNLDDMSSGGGFRYEFSLQPGNLQWTSGTEIIYEEYTWKLDKDNTIINHNSEKRNQYSFFTNLTYRISALSLSAATALNYISYSLVDRFPADGDQSGKHRFDPVFSPRLGANYKVSEHLSVYASAGHGFSMPSTEETLLPEGLINNNIKPEKGFQYESGVRIGSGTSRFEADAAVYLIDLNNLLVTKRLSEDIFTGINAGKTRHYGLELQLRADVFASNRFPGKITSSASYTWSRNRFVDFNDDGTVYDGRYLPGIPDQVLNAGLNWLPFKSITISPQIQYTGFQYLTDDNSLKYPGYLIFSVRASSVFSLKGSRMTAFAGINNLTGTEYASMVVVNALPPPNGEPRYYYPGMPWNFYFGLSLTAKELRN